jgi:hypothetical protein
MLFAIGKVLQTSDASGLDFNYVKWKIAIIQFLQKEKII